MSECTTCASYARMRGPRIRAEIAKMVATAARPARWRQYLADFHDLHQRHGPLAIVDRSGVWATSIEAKSVTVSEIRDLVPTIVEAPMRNVSFGTIVPVTTSHDRIVPRKIEGTLPPPRFQS